MFKLISPAERSEWAEKIRQQKESFLNATDWCRKHQIPYASFLYWKDVLASKARIHRYSFLEIPDTPSKCSIEYQGIRLHVDEDCDPASLATYLSALRKLHQHLTHKKLSSVSKNKGRKNAQF